MADFDSQHDLPLEGDTAELMRFEPWLRLVAKLEIDNRLQGKFSQSDVVQQTLIEAWRNWDRFTADDDPERQRMGWLRRILANQLASLERRFVGAQKRDVNREVSIDQSLAQTSWRLEGMLADNISSPSAQFAKRENALRLAHVLDRLPDDYREVIALRHLEELSHGEIAERLGRSEGAVRMLWVRALAQLKREISA
jgi:RNA polymerase sigma-70 factor, ECF subfamily